MIMYNQERKREKTEIRYLKFPLLLVVLMLLAVQSSLVTARMKRNYGPYFRNCTTSEVPEHLKGIAPEEEYAFGCTSIKMPKLLLDDRKQNFNYFITITVSPQVTVLGEACDASWFIRDRKRFPYNDPFTHLGADIPTLNFTNCIDYFCNPYEKTSEGENWLSRQIIESSEFHSVDRAAKRLHQSVYNACLYCRSRSIFSTVLYDQYGNSNGTEQSDFDLFHQKIWEGTCPHFFSSKFVPTTLQSVRKHCGGTNAYRDHRSNSTRIDTKANLMQKTGIPYLFLSQRPQFIENPYMCYCPKSKLWGYRCDSYTSFWIPFRYYALSPVLTIMFWILTACLIICVIVPHIHVTIRKTRQFNADEKKLIFFSWVNPRFLAMLMLTLSALLIGLAQIFNYWGTVGGNTSFVIRIFGVLLILPAFVTIIVIWINVLHNAEKQASSDLMDWRLGIALVISYLCTLCLIILPILSEVLKQSLNRIVSLVFIIICFLFSAVSSLLFLLYGLLLFYKLNKMQKAHLCSYKFTKFMFLVVFIYCGFILQTIFLAIQYGFGMDILGFWYEVFVYIWLDFSIWLLIVVATYLLYSEEAMFTTFPFLAAIKAKLLCCGSSNQNEAESSSAK